MANLDWARLLCSDRRAPPAEAVKLPDKPPFLMETRHEAERDYDRLLFATPTRRLADKTQVFPLEPNDSIRTRLTHSHEVSNLARSIGTHLAGDLVKRLGGGHEYLQRDIPATLAAIGLAHDLGNPPFGHQGEFAIQRWVENNQKKIFDVSGDADDNKRNEIAADLAKLTAAMRADFLKFEGNAQTLRVVTKLQVINDNRGLNLTFGTLAAVMKYTAPSDRTEKRGDVSKKKHGYFQSEEPLVALLREKTGVAEGVRHPLAHLMEACDDAAYHVLDAEDAVKKGLVSFSDVVAYMRAHLGDDDFTKWILNSAEEAHKFHRTQKLTPAELNDVSMQLFRVHSIGALVSAIIETWSHNYDAIMNGSMTKPLFSQSRARKFLEHLFKFNFTHAYKHPRVLALELEGFNVIHQLMDMLWRGITERVEYSKLDSGRTTPFANYVYGRISENYRRCFLGELLDGGDLKEPSLPIRYRELQLLTDMVSGMTDSFAMRLFKELKHYAVGPSHG